MRKRLAGIAVFGLLLCGGNAACAAQRYAVELSGAGNLSKLLNEHLDIRRHENDEDIGQEEVQRLVDITPQQIRDLLATEGYFSAVVQPALVREGDRWLARFNIVPGERTRVSGVEIRFSGAITQGGNDERMTRLRRNWELKPGEPFRQAAWDDAKTALLKNLLNRTYPAARIAHSEAQVDLEKHAAALKVEIDSGPAFTFGALEIQGLKRYSRDMIDTLNPIKAGEPFSQERLNELQARLQDTGYFKSAFATIEVDAAHPQNVPVRVDITENELKRLSLGGGFSTDAGARLQAKWLHRRFMGRDLRLESELKLERQNRLLGSDLFFPALRNGWHPSLGAHYERSDITGELVDKVRTDARLTSPLKSDEQIWGVSYLADKQRVADIINHRHALIGTYSYTMRRVDNLLKPNRGYVASVELAAGPQGVLNESNLVRVYGRVNWLKPLAPHWQALVRGQIGQVIGAPRSEVPGDLLFRTGGDQTVRGYAYNSLGVGENGAVVGGRVLAVLSGELVYRFTPAYGVAVFTDAGDAADSWRDFNLKRGTGVGARWNSPIGPVNIDLAYGHATHKPRLHFSIGYGF